MEHSPQENSKTSMPRQPAIATVVFVAVLVMFVAMRIGSSASEADLPKARLESLGDGWVDEKRCAECHEELETFWETGHANTLRPASDPASLELLDELNEFLGQSSKSTTVQVRDDIVLATHDENGAHSQVKLDWCFGSGEHARTWVGTLSDSQGATDLLEFRWSWFEHVDGLSRTPGQFEDPQPGYFHSLGTLFDPPKARKCFGCHSSYLPVKSGEIQTHAMKAGVTCQRCHGPRQAHVDSEGDITDDSWRTASQLESVHRCAECHRRAEEHESSEITHENKDIIRFQPVGLVQAPCFKGSKMTCITCHDPHKSLKAQDSLGIWQCLQCHDGTEKHRPFCSAGHMDNCIQCHMPKVKMEDPLEFTDHWIRIRKESESPR